MCFYWLNFAVLSNLEFLFTTNFVTYSHVTVRSKNDFESIEMIILVLGHGFAKIEIFQHHFTYPDKGILKQFWDYLICCGYMVRNCSQHLGWD